MLVRLAIAWTDSVGIAHGAGELVDIDVVTLAELEEQGVVETMSDTPKESKWIGPTSPTPDGEPEAAWIGPTSEPTVEAGWIGPTSDDDEDDK